MIKSIQVHIHLDPLDPLNPNISSIQFNYLFLIILNKDKATYVSKLFLLFYILFPTCILQGNDLCLEILIVFGLNSGSGVSPEEEGRQPGPEGSTEFEALGKLLLRK